MAVIMIGAQMLMKPKASSNKIKPASASEFDVPTAEEGRAVPILFGTRRVSGPNVVWYGDISATAIRK